MSFVPLRPFALLSHVVFFQLLASILQLRPLHRRRHCVSEFVRSRCFGAQAKDMVSSQAQLVKRSVTYLSSLLSLADSSESASMSLVAARTFCRFAAGSSVSVSSPAILTSPSSAYSSCRFAVGVAVVPSIGLRGASVVSFTASPNFGCCSSTPAFLAKWAASAARSCSRRSRGPPSACPPWPGCRNFKWVYAGSSRWWKAGPFWVSLPLAYKIRENGRG